VLLFFLKIRAGPCMSFDLNSQYAREMSYRWSMYYMTVLYRSGISGPKTCKALRA
jgi:hypothetical protein